MKLQICTYTCLFWFPKHLFTGFRDSDFGSGKKLFSLLENTRTALASIEPPVQLSSRSFPWGKVAGVCKLVIMSAVPVRVHGIDRDSFTCTLGGRNLSSWSVSSFIPRTSGCKLVNLRWRNDRVVSVPERSLVSSAWFAASLCWNLAYVAHNCTNYVQRGVTWPLDILCVWASCVKRGRRAVSPLNPAPPLMLAVPNRYCSIPCTRETNSLSYLPK